MGGPPAQEGRRDAPDRTQHPHPNGFQVEAVSPDGRTVALVQGTGARSRVTLRDADTGAFLRETPWQPDSLAGLAFSPDSRRLLTWGSGPATASLWDVATLGQARPLMRSLDLAIQQAAFSADGGTVLLGCREGTAHLWDVERDAEAGPSRDAPPRHAYPITAVAFDPQSTKIVTGCHAGTVRLWDRTDGRLLHDLRGNAGEIAALAFSPDGTTLLTASFDATARFWDVESGLQLGPPLHHTDAVLGVAFHPGGRSVTTATKDGAAHRWLVPPAPLGGDVAQIRKKINELTGLELNDQGAVFVTSDLVGRRRGPSSGLEPRTASPTPRMGPTSVGK